MRPHGQYSISAGDKDLSNTATPLRRHPIPEVIHCFTHLKDSDWGNLGPWWPSYGGCAPNATCCPASQAPDAELESMGQPMERGCRNAEAPGRAPSRSLHCRISPCASTTPFKWLQITSFFSRGDIDPVWFSLTIYQTWLGQHFIPDSNGHLKNLFLKISRCNAVTIAFKQKGNRSSLEEEGMILPEKKEKLIMAQGKMCFSDTILILSWVLLVNGSVA